MNPPRLSCAICRSPSRRPAPNVTMIMQASIANNFLEQIARQMAAEIVCQYGLSSNILLKKGPV